jgi:hypothetical protein
MAADDLLLQRENSMRLPLIAPTDLTAEQRPLYADMKAGIEKNFQASRRSPRAAR